MRDLEFKYVDRVPPQRMTEGSAGIDLPADIDIIIKPGDRELIPTGICVAIPEGHVGLVCSRSGLAWETGMVVLNAPGIIDADYRGQLYVIMANLGKVDHKISRGDRVAQLVITPCWYGAIKETDELPGHEIRGCLGSTNGYTRGGPGHDR